MYQRNTKIISKVHNSLYIMCQRNMTDIMRIFSCRIWRREFWQKIIDISEKPDVSTVTTIQLHKK
jgi:hypothetical protein